MQSKQQFNVKQQPSTELPYLKGSTAVSTNTSFVHFNMIKESVEDRPYPCPLSLEPHFSDSSGPCSPLALSPITTQQFIMHNEVAFSPDYVDEIDDPLMDDLCLGVDYTNGTTVSTSVSVGTTSTRSRSRSNISSMWRNMDKAPVTAQILPTESALNPIPSYSMIEGDDTENEPEDGALTVIHSMDSGYHFCDYDSDGMDGDEDGDGDDDIDRNGDDDGHSTDEDGESQYEFLRTPPTLCIQHTAESKTEEFVVHKRAEPPSQRKESEDEILLIPSLEVSYSMTRQGTNEHATPSPQQLCVHSHLAGLYSAPSDDEMNFTMHTIPSKAPSVQPPPAVIEDSRRKKGSSRRKYAKYVAPKHIQQKVNLHRAIQALSRHNEQDGKSRKYHRKQSDNTRDRKHQSRAHPQPPPPRQSRHAKKFDFSVPPDQIVLSEEACQHLVDLCEYHTADEAECNS